MIHSRIRDRRSIKNSPTNQLLPKPKDDAALPCMVSSTPDLHTQANILEMLKTNSDDISMYGDVEASRRKYYKVKSIGKDLPYKNTAVHLNVNENGANPSSFERSPKTCPKLAPNLELFKVGKILHFQLHIYYECSMDEGFCSFSNICFRLIIKSHFESF